MIRVLCIALDDQVNARYWQVQRKECRVAGTDDRLPFGTLATAGEMLRRMLPLIFLQPNSDPIVSNLSALEQWRHQQIARSQRCTHSYCVAFQVID